MKYLTREMSVNAIRRMKTFHDDIVGLYNEYDMDLLDNLGRRNIVMSQTQEKFFSDELTKKYEGVSNDGKTGQPDIIVGELNKELECKLTSRHKSGSINFQTDHSTLSQKGALDYLYVIADNKFKKFGVLHFIGLTVDDFRPVANGSRGKVSMYKHVGMKKCNVLVGDVSSVNEENLEKLFHRLKNERMSLTSKKREKTIASIQYWQTTPTKYRFGLEEII